MVQARPWEADELEDAVESASAHVRFLLRELSESRTPKTSEELRSRAVAFAITQRLCRARGREELLQFQDRGGRRLYSLHEGYRAQITPLVAGAKEPPPAEPRAKKPRRPKASARPAVVAYTALQSGTPSGATMGSPAPGAAAPGMRSGAAPAPSRGPIAPYRQRGDEVLVLPDDVSLQFCEDLIRFVGRTGAQVRLVLDGAGRRLELF